jgi:nucleoside-diphosphate-sugar epimerase
MVLNVFLTGAFGNVGMNVVRYFVNRNASFQREDNPLKVQLTCFDKKSPLTIKNYESLLREFQGNTNAFVTIWGDLTEPEQVKEAVKGQDAVIHLAAVIPPVAYKIPEVAKKVNVDGTKNLLNACSSLPKPPRFVFASSYSVHGPKNSSKPVELMNGNTPINPADIYASHKGQSEQMVRAYKGEWAILRLGAVSTTLDAVFRGPALPQKEADLMLYAIPANQRRHGVHSKDAAKAFAQCAITTNNVNGKVFMIGGDDSWRTNSLNFANAIFESLGVGALWAEAFRKPSGKRDQAFYYEEWMDTQEAQQLLAFQDHTFQDWKKELSNEVNFVQYWLTRFFSPIIRYWMSSRSKYYKLNKSGLPYAEAESSLTELLGTNAE